MNGRNKNQSNENNKSIDLYVIKDLLEIEKDKISLRKSELGLKTQSIKEYTELAKQSLTSQEKLLERAPKERRKDRGQILIFGVILTLILLVFFAFCLIYGFEEFLTNFIAVLSHSVILALGYYFGVRNRKFKKEDTKNQSLDIIS